MQGSPNHFKLFNPYYANIAINEGAINALPEVLRVVFELSALDR